MNRLTERVRALTTARAPAVDPVPEDWTPRDVAVDEGAAQPVARRLLDRLRPEDVEAVEAVLDAEAAALWEQATPPHRAYLTLAYGVHFRVPGVLERSGLTTDAPPPEVHAMGRGPLAAGGDYYTADLVAEALQRSASTSRPSGAASTSGARRPASCALSRPPIPDVEWHGVDPNTEAVAWAGEHVRGAHFSPSASDPPLGFPDAHFDLVYAISIWSHFGERYGAGSGSTRCDRVLSARRPPRPDRPQRPSRSPTTARLGARSQEQLTEIAVALHRHGFWYAPEFGSAGDHGVVHPEWGTAFMSAEWLLRAVDAGVARRLLRGRPQRRQPGRRRAPQTSGDPC